MGWRCGNSYLGSVHVSVGDCVGNSLSPIQFGNLLTSKGHFDREANGHFRSEEEFEAGVSCSGLRAKVFD